jgi:hypothetical protein
VEGMDLTLRKEIAQGANAIAVWMILFTMALLLDGVKKKTVFYK